MFGTSVLGGLCAYPVAVLLMGTPAGSVAFYGYVIPFLISTVGGTILAAVIILSLQTDQNTENNPTAFGRSCVKSIENPVRMSGEKNERNFATRYQFWYYFKAGQRIVSFDSQYHKLCYG